MPCLPRIARRRPERPRRRCCDSIAALTLLLAGVLAQGCAHRSAPPRATASGPAPRTGGDYPGARWIPAPRSNYRAAERKRPDVRWIVIHTTELSAADTVRRLTDPASRVSVHYLVTRDGRVIQFVRDQDISYGAGNLAYNEAAINIEHERYDGAEVTAAELRASRDLVQWLVQRFAITPRIVPGLAPPNPSAGSGIIGHNQVPDLHHVRGGGENHHTDPVNWDWRAYAAGLDRR